jgi:MoxR-like ATPase
VSQAISDRMCRIAIGYQDEAGEREIVTAVTGHTGPLVAPAVALARRTRAHPQVRMGASVRGATDLVRLGIQLAVLRGEGEPAPGDATFADAAVAALSGRLRLEEDAEATPEAIVLELIAGLKADAVPPKAPAPPAVGPAAR